MQAVADPELKHWRLILLAAGVLAITMGARQTLGLFVSPINSTTGLGITTISFAMAVSQFVLTKALPRELVDQLPSTASLEAELGRSGP